MHILQMYKDYPPVVGGIENHLGDLATALAERGHHVTVLVTSLGRETEVEQPGANLTVIKAGRLGHAASTPLSPAMMAAARRQRPDVVHLHMPYPPGDLAALMVPGRVPLVTTYHSDIVRQKTLLKLYRPLLEHTLRRAARILATSPAYVASSPFLRRYAAKCEVVPLGIDLARFQPPAINRQSGPFELLFVGRLRYYKGLHVLLAALPHTKARLLIAGSGPELEPLQAQAARLGLSQRVRFLGDVADQDLPRLYQTADAFVLPAHLRAEALGIAQLEAMASGLPCISTELGTGTSYANVDHQTGLVVPPSDPRALAAAINSLHVDPGLRGRLGQAARQRALDVFSRERMVDAVERVYASVLRAG